MAKKKRNARRKPGGKGQKEVPPVIIKGGSIQVEFRDVPFDDADNHTQVNKVSHPDSTVEIGSVEIRDFPGNLLGFYKVPTNLNGKCIISVIAVEGQ